MSLASNENKTPNSPHKQPTTKYRSRYVPEIQSIMYTCGDVKQPLIDTAQALEEILHDILVRLMRSFAASSGRRGIRALAAEDLLFFFRHDSSKLDRLRQYLQWREVRKLSSKDDEQIDELDQPQPTSKRKPAPRLSWMLTALVDPEMLQNGWEESDDGLLDWIDDIQNDNVRSKHADALTKSMSKEEYLEYSECRQASFTYKKGKKFREWLSPASCTDYRVGDELLEMFGLIACMLVEALTIAALDCRDESNDGQISNNSAFSISIFQKPSAKTALSVSDIRKAYFRLMETDILLRLVQ